jgi:hypothetical protein
MQASQPPRWIPPSEDFFFETCPSEDLSKANVDGAVSEDNGREDWQQSFSEIRMASILVHRAIVCIGVTDHLSLKALACRGALADLSYPRNLCSKGLLTRGTLTNAH